MENAVGYVQNVSPTKKSSKRKISYFDFQLQTGENEHTRAICFQPSMRGTLQSYETSGIPVKIRNVTKKESPLHASQMDLVLNVRSVVEKANTSEISYEGTPSIQETPNVHVKDIDSLDSGQMIILSGLLTTNKDGIRTLDVNGSKKRVLDNCLITDSTGNAKVLILILTTHSRFNTFMFVVGSIRLTLWEDSIDNLESAMAYKFTNLRVKEFGGKKHLTATPASKFEKIENEYQPPPEDILETKATRMIRSVESIINFSKWYVCKNCSKQLTEVRAKPHINYKFYRCVTLYMTFTSSILDKFSYFTYLMIFYSFYFF